MTKRLPWILLLVPFLLLVCWHSMNWAYPRSDAGDYFSATQTIQLSFKDGFSNGLFNLYFTRVWKNIIHPNLGAPILVLLNGNVLATVATATTAWYAILVVYLFYLLSFLLSGWGAAIGTLAIGLVPWLFGMAKIFNSDLPGIMCAIAAVAHLLRASERRSPWQAAAFSFWLGLGLCTRPVETVLLLWIPTVVVVVRALKEKNVRVRDVFLLIVACAPFFVGLFYSISIRGNLRVVPGNLILWLAGFWGPAIVLVALRKRLGLSTWFLAGSLPCLLVVSGWFLPTTYGVYAWIFQSTFSNWAAVTGGRGQMDSLHFFLKIFDALCGYPLMILCCVGALSRTARVPQGRTWLYIFGALSVLSPALVGATTFNADVRYYFSAAVIAMAMAVSWALRPDGLYYQARVLCVSALVLMYCAIFYASVTDPHQIPEELAQRFREVGVPNYPLRFQDPAIDLIGRLEKTLPKTKLLISMVPLDSNQDVEATFDPWLLTIVAQELGHDWRFERIHPFNGENAEKQLQMNNNHADFTLLGPLNGSADPRTDSHNPILLLAGFIRNHEESGTLEAIGLKKIDLVEVTGRDGSRDQLLLSQNRPTSAN